MVTMLSGPFLHLFSVIFFNQELPQIVDLMKENPRARAVTTIRLHRVLLNGAHHEFREGSTRPLELANKGKEEQWKTLEKAFEAPEMIQNQKDEVGFLNKAMDDVKTEIEAQLQRNLPATTEWEVEAKTEDSYQLRCYDKDSNRPCRCDLASGVLGLFRKGTTLDDLLFLLIFF